MTFTYDPGSATNLAKVRLLITDTDVTRPILSDEDIALFLSITGDEPLYAAAMAMESIAANEALCSKVVNILGLQVDGASVAKNLRASAKAMREDAARVSSDPGFRTIELADDFLQRREKYWKELQREGLAW